MFACSLCTLTRRKYTDSAPSPSVTLIIVIQHQVNTPHATVRALLPSACLPSGGLRHDFCVCRGCGPEHLQVQRGVPATPL